MKTKARQGAFKNIIIDLQKRLDQVKRNETGKLGMTETDATFEDNQI